MTDKYDDRAGVADAEVKSKTVIDDRYLLVTSRVWNESMAGRLTERCGREFELVTNKYDLSPEKLEVINPKYLFFPHWSYMIPKEIYENYQCVIFHMTDLPFGRGGSPLQNLISRGIKETQISALLCAEALDAGPIFMKRPLTLEGKASEIYLRAGAIIEEMIVEIIETDPRPIAQSGEPVFFKRRKPEESRVAENMSVEQLYDHIRMLDADGYPQAFLESAGFRFEFKDVSLNGSGMKAEVNITKVTDE